MAALKPAFESRRGVWIGWAGHPSGPPRKLPGLGAELVQVPLTRKDVEGHYHGFSNSTLWPLFHCLPDRVTINGRWWHQYRAVNLRFAERAIDGGVPGRGLLGPRLPARLRPAACSGRSARPSRSASSCTSRSRPRSSSRACRGVSTLLEGLLGADVVSFQTEEYRENFLRACLRLRPDATAEGAVLRLARRTIGPDGDASDLDRRARAPRAGPVGGGRARARPAAEHSSPGGASSSASIASTTRRESSNACARSSCCSRSDATCAARSPSSRSQCRVAATSASTESCAPRSRRWWAGSTDASRSRARTSPSTISIAAFRRPGCSPTTAWRTSASSRRCATG